MNPLLLRLYQKIKTGECKQQQMSDVLSLSVKQTSRLLQKWQEEGWLRYIPGKGRGKNSYIEWLKPIEELFLKKAIQSFQENSIEETAKLLTYDWSISSKERLTSLFQTKMGFIRDENDRLIIPIRFRFVTFHPLEAVDCYSANLVSSLYDRLVNVDEEGRFSSGVAHSWECLDKRFRCYLRKGVRFHDGSLLMASDVVTCLDKLRHHPQHAVIWEPIHQISTPAPYVVDFELNESLASYMLPLLSNTYASIYKEYDGKIIGTGSFYLVEDTETRTILKAFDYYYKERPLLDKIEFIRVPQDFKVVYHTSQTEKEDATFQVKSDSGFGIVVMNFCHESPLKNPNIRHYIHQIIANSRHEIMEKDNFKENFYPNAEGFQLGNREAFHIPPIKDVPKLSRPLIMQVVNYTKDMSYWLKEKLEAAGIQIVIQHKTFDEALYGNLQEIKADLLIFGEVYEVNPQYSFFCLVKGLDYSISQIFSVDPAIKELSMKYKCTPIEHWKELNHKIEKLLIEKSILIPLYYSKRNIPFTSDLQNISIKSFGYVDFASLWMKPNMNMTSDLD
ncbi:ABC transporter substrate-binding protein [Rummeliibacillus suwonensis]|uniref:ABC transporter substrate-binding protein n=1 Tax=Rummeliibacillus suwonensis TaxID=1306154 RepID=UPI001AAF8B1F|nr:ABC transporter substrate-binding protein [Rummeliibacillus suwonensis]MBO2536645.1 SgrR family transcriptional regulator [Rummeliibacillus suwonensis]